MKRPEGVSAPSSRGVAAPPPNLAAPKTAVPKLAPPTERGAAPQRAAKPEPRQKPERAAGEGRRAGRSRDRSARAELRAAERARKRFERDEVKRFTRHARRRRLGWVVALGLLVVVGGLVVGAVFSPVLALRTITIDGTSRLDSSELQKAVDGQLGTPLALVDYGELTRDLAPFSLIRSYVTEIVPPNTLVIHVVERTPVGAIQTASGFELVDPAGVVISTSEVRPDGFPLIAIGSGKISGAGFSSMTEVLLALPTAVRSKVDTVSALTHDDVTLTLAGSSQRVVWGSSDDSDAKARVLAELIALHGDGGAGEYDVSAPGTAVFHQG